MKYPQLVSARAVNAISDWLVSRLERLGVDAPLVYSRLLLSLLHTPLQINALDFADIPAQLKLKGGCLGRKVGRRLTQSEAETLKRFAAIESLMDVTASDQLKTEVEDLVDELCEKLREIEQQQNNIESEEENIIINNTSFIEKLNKKSNFKNLSDKPSPSEDPDPTKRYYRAFPSLSKELKAKDNNREEIKPRLMPLTWPCGSTGLNFNNINSIKSSNTNKMGINNAANAVSSNTAGVIKRKQKRRRNHNNNNNQNHGLLKNYNNNKKKNNSVSEDEISEKASSLWDTNFEGSWEMGHDLIKDFIMKQNKRNRSISENDASQFNFKELNDKNRSGNMIKSMITTSVDTIDHRDTDDGEDFILASMKTENQKFWIYDETNITSNEDFLKSEPLSSFNDICDTSSPCSRRTNNNSGQLFEPRRLYEREVSPESINDNIDNENLALFEAKFNSSVEALWDDKEQPSTTTTSENNFNPNRNDLNLFWSNYYKHQYKPITTTTTTQNQSQSLLNDPFDHYRSNISNNLLSGILDISNNPRKINNTNNEFTSLNINRHDFIESGTNLQSSIWSTNPDNNNNCNESNDNKNDDCGLYARDLWDNKMNSNHKNENLTNELCGGYSIDSFVNFSKWSDCSYEAPFIPSSSQTSSHHQYNKNQNDYQNQHIGYKSLPIMNNTITSTATKKNFRSDNFYTQVLEVVTGTSVGNVNHVKINQISSTTPNNDVEEIEIPRIKPTIILDHSETSRFRKVCSKPVNYNSYYDRQYRNVLESNRKRYFQERERYDEENCLLAERTHFRPIKQTYIDGYAFDIACKVEHINYQRSKSGFLYHDSEKYMEYNYVDSNSSFITTKCDSSGFCLKLNLKQNDKSCQTDESGAHFYDNNVNDGFVKSSFYRCDIKPNRIKQKIDDDIEMECQLKREQAKILNYCVCYEQRYDLDDDDDDLTNDLDLRRFDNNNYCNNVDNFKRSSNVVCSVHPLCNDDIENWSLNKIKNNCVNNNHTHTLWGHCATCNNNDDILSIPADCMLKAELSADGDEIMSDLKYMQNLFIGTDWNDDDEDDEDSILLEHDDDDDDLLYDDDDDDGDDDDDDNFNLDDDYENPNDFALEFNKDKHENKDDDLVYEEMYCNVNKLIADLLKPETAKSITQILGERQGQTILEEIAMSDKNQKFNDWYSYKNVYHLSTSNPISSSFNNNNNNNYISSDEIFGLWKRHDEDNNIGDWENCKNLKSIIENNKNENVTDYGGHEPSDYFNDQNRFEIITLWNNNEDDHDEKISESTNVPIYFDIFEENDNYFNHHYHQGENHQPLFGHHTGLLTTVTDLNAAINYNNVSSSSSGIKRVDRKRRHSASQNLNEDLFGCDQFTINSNNNEDTFGVTATVITCKYWTDESSILPKYENDLTVHPTSILKHVQMVSRPLTR